MLQVVAGIIFNSQHEILISYRPPHAIQGDLWEFPGGKIEANETPYDALIRELKEEVDIEVVTATPFECITHTYPEHTVVLHVWSVTEFKGEPHGKEGQIVRWVAPQALSTFTFPEGNKVIIDILLGKTFK